MEQFQTLLILMVVIWLFGKLFRQIGLPMVLGELLGGVVVGPLGLALIHPDSEMIKTLSELGVFFLMLHTGLENDPRGLIKNTKKSVLVALGSICSGVLVIFITTQLFKLPVAEGLFVALSLALSAIAISIRLLKDQKLQKSEAGQIALGAMIIVDIIGLSFFSVLLNVMNAGVVDAKMILIMLLKLALFFGIVIFAGFKLQNYFNGWLKSKGFTLTLIIALGLGLIAESIGLHIIIGAFLAGLFIREEIIEEKTYNKIEDRIYGLSYSFLGPIFFASLAFNLKLSAVFTQPFLVICLLLAMYGSKFFGARTAARLQKLDKSQSTVIGFIMNTKGAVVFIMAAIGLENGIITNETFSVVIIVAFISTVLTILGIKLFTKKFAIK